MAGFLDRVEDLGNRLPHPATLFAIALVLVMLLSAIAAGSGWSVQKVTPSDSAAAEVLVAKNLKLNVLRFDEKAFQNNVIITECAGRFASC